VEQVWINVDAALHFSGWKRNQLISVRHTDDIYIINTRQSWKVPARQGQRKLALGLEGNDL
jgi:hypothetical protein